MITLRLFGSPSVDGPGGSRSGPATQHRRLALLALLAAHPETGLRRDKILAYLWPEADAERGRHLLSNAAYALRQALGRDVILSPGGDVLRLNPDRVRADLWDFLHALAHDEPRRAAQLYAGPFLDGFFVSGAPEFEQWAESERSRLARRCAQVLGSLAEGAEREADLGGAVEWWRKLAEHDPFSSRVALRLMQALVTAGDTGGALQHARAHALLLNDQLGIDPDPSVGALVQELQAERRPRPGPVDRVPPLPPAQPSYPAALPSPDPAGRRGSRRSAALIGLPLLLLIATGLLYSGRRAEGLGPENAAAIRSLAVLPLENCTPDPVRADRPDPAQEYFADGLTDALITELAQIPGLRVISRTSIMRYKGECGSYDRAARSLPEIARELGVDAVVEGSVVRDRERVRINAQLIRAATDEHLWADGLEYDRDVRDVLDLQREIVAAIAGSVRARADLPPLPYRSAQHRADPSAYTLYLKGRYLWNQHQIASYRVALDHFQEAVAIDSTFAPAYAGMADVYVHLDEWGGRPERDARQEGFRAARRALALDPSLSEAHASLAHLLMHVEDWAAAGHEYLRAIQLNPNNGNARILYAFHLSALERHDDAIHQAVRTLEVDPLSPRAHSFAGYTFYFARRYDEAVTQWQRLLELDPQSAGPHFLIALAHLNAGRQAEGLAWARRGAALGKGGPAARAILAHCLAIAGRQEEAREVLANVLRGPDLGGLDPLILAKAYARLGDRDPAFRWLDTALEGDHGWLMFLRVEPAYDPLRTDPRFAELLQRLRLDTQHSIGPTKSGAPSL